MPVICLIIHGIGTQDQNFSDPLQKGVHRQLTSLLDRQSKTDAKGWQTAKATDLVDFATLYWANVESDEQNNLYRTIYPDLFGTQSTLKKFFELGTKLAPVRSLSVRLIGDIFGYLGKFQERIKREVFRQLVTTLGPRLESGQPFSIILVGHSLGSVILHDLISGFLRYHYAGFDAMVRRISVFTMGSPISLFSLAADSAKPQQFAKWVNFLYPRDPVAFPMASIFSVQDVSLWSASLNLLALHSAYWNNGTVHSHIAQEIIRHYQDNFVTPLKLGPLGEVPPEIFQSFHRPAAEAGFANYVADFQRVPFEALIQSAKEIDICNVYAETWTKAKAEYFTNALGNPQTILRVCMLSPDSPSLPGISYQFSGMQADELRARIRRTTQLYLQILEEARRRFHATGRLLIYYCLTVVNHTFYRFDDLMCFVPRPLASSKLAATPIPVLIFRRGCGNTDFYYWLMRDFNLVLQTNHDAVLHFDSANHEGEGGPTA